MEGRGWRLGPRDRGCGVIGSEAGEGAGTGTGDGDGDGDGAGKRMGWGERARRGGVES